MWKSSSVWLPGMYHVFVLFIEHFIQQLFIGCQAQCWGQSKINPSIGGQKKKSSGWCVQTLRVEKQWWIQETVSISEWVGPRLRKNEVWESTQQTGRGQIGKLLWHAKKWTEYWRNGKPQNIFNQESDSIRFVFCKDYFGSYMEEFGNQINLIWISAMFAHYFVSSLPLLFGALFIIPSNTTISK